MGKAMYAGSSSPEVPEEIRLLCMLHNIGATTPEKSLSLPEIRDWTAQEISTVQPQLQNLMSLGYVESSKTEGVDKYHVTLDGIRKVLSMYS
ncbi:MAG: hypothetical protein OEX77_06965 [Candidatus Bathyarchaeota archaeon]|nr:hypothetical protein [Candidatus Bathyarchaeota archaeon]MDH5732466.1 hypothetical protein [Candidatus Bathyarchaeota archaeon]